jgi:hypothetical protein
MLKIRSSTLFRVLCGAIVVMAIALLGLAGTMVSSYVWPEAPTTIASPNVTGRGGSVKQIDVANNSKLAQKKLWPAKSAQANGAPLVLDESNQVIFIGMWGDSAIFQHKGTRKQWRVKTGQAAEGVKLVALDGGAKQAEIRNVVNNTESPQAIKLRLVDALDNAPTSGGRRGTGPMGSSAGGGPASPSVGGPGSSGRPSGPVTSSSGPAASGTVDRTTITIGASGSSSGGPATSGTAQRFTSAPIRTTSGNGSTGSGSAGGGDSATPATGASGSNNTNWRQYWAERMKSRQQQQENSGTPAAPGR